MNVLQPKTDHLAIFVQRIHTDGVWCDTSVNDRIVHKFICRHPSATVAISLCGMIIKPIKKLHENVVSQKCLVCDLFDTTGKEAAAKTLPQLNDALDKYETKSTTDKE